MKKIITFCLVLVFVFALVSPGYAYADPLSAFALGGIAYAIGQYSGLGFIFGNASSSAVSDYMESQIGDYAGGDIATKFALDEARLVAGKLIVGPNLFNDIKDFLSWLIDGKSDGDIILPGEINGIVIGNLNRTESSEIAGYRFLYSEQENGSLIQNKFNVFSGQLDVSRVTIQYSPSTFSRVFLGWQLNQVEGGFNVTMVLQQTRYSSGEVLTVTGTTIPNFVMDGVVENTGTINVSEYNDETIDVGYQWEGTFPEVPDTNIDELIGGIYEDVADTNLEVEGEITEVGPAPTPVPTIAPDIPLQDVPWEGLNDLVDQTGKDITDSVQDGAKDITDALDGLKDQTAEQTGEIVQSIEGVQDGVKDLEDTISEALTAPEINEKTFDLRELFPFCIPFDIYHLLQKFDSSPAAPHVQLPIVIQSIGFSYMLDLDFSAWDPVAAAMRTVELIVYALGLAWATSKVIKW